MVKIDTGAYLDGFHGDSCISICVGEVSSKAQKLSDIAYEALYALENQGREYTSMWLGKSKILL